VYNFRMKKFLLLTGLVAAAARAALVDGPAAKVNGELITLGDVSAEINRSGARPDAEGDFQSLYRETIDTLVERKLIVQAALARKIDIQESMIDDRVREIVKSNFGGDMNALKEALARSRSTFEDWRAHLRDDMIVAAMRWQMVDKNATATPAAMKRAYEADPDKYAEPATVTVRVILLKPSDGEEAAVSTRADEILEKLAAGGDFAALAREYSSDSHAADGGLWENVVAEEAFRPEICDALAALKPGAHSKMIDLDGWGFIVRKDAEKAARRLSFAEAHDRLAADVRDAKAKKLYADWIRRLKADAFVKIYPMPER